MRECLFRFWMGRWTRELLATALILFACSSADASVPGVETGPTNSISGLTQTSVNLMGGVTNLGGTTVTNAGFFLNTNSTATNGVKYSAPGSSFLVGPFSNTITGLTPGTSYYYRAFAVNSVGTGYGANEYSFTTPSPSPFTYTTSTAGVTITGYTGTGGAVEIPATIGGVAVTKIGDNAFQGMVNLTAVVIPESVTSIGSNAFFFCTSLASITIPDSVLVIGENAFWNCHELKSAIIGSGVTALPRNAFSECWELTSVTLGANIKTLGDYAFNNCAKLKGITFPAGFESMGSYAFALCADLTSITFPESLHTIGNRAFQQCTKLTTVNFQGNTPPTIEGEAFSGIAIGAKGYYPATAIVNWTGVTYPGIVIRSNDQTAPLIILVGANSVTIYKGSIFTDLGATVTDNVDVTRAILGSGAVNTATVGIYTLTYTAADASGNLAVPVTRTVNVVNKATPTITGLPGFMSATGGTISGSGDFIIHTFRNVGSSTFQSMGSGTVEILVVAGGGGAGYDGGGGGGAGGVITNTVSVTAGTEYTVVVGGGGAAATGPQWGPNRSPGGDSQFGALTAIGGAGGYNGHAEITATTTGGSGGGEGFTGGGPGNGTPGQGNRGGYKSMDSAGGGGGGAGEVGGNASSGRGGNGGNGIQSGISGVATWYGGGGAGGSWEGIGGTGGLGGGGNAGGNAARLGSDGTPNTGGGGGGNGYASATSGKGGSGVVIVRYKPKILTYGQSIGEATFSGATASVPGSFAFVNPSATPAAGNNSLSVIFTPTDTASYETVTTSVLVFVAQATPTVISNPTSTAIGYGQNLASSALSGGVASVPGTFAFSNPASAPETGTSIQSVIFTPSDRVNYNAVTVPVQVTVNKATPIITAAPTATSIGYGQTLGSSTLGGGVASVLGSFAWTSPSTSPNAGTASQGVTFTPADKANYTTATTSVSVTVNKATPSITMTPTATSIAYGQTLEFSTLSGGVASVPGSFAWTAPSTLLNAGTVSQSVTFNPTDTANYNTATTSVSVTVNAALISSGFSHTLYLGAGAATVTAWGLNTDGRLGVGNMDSPVNWAKAVLGIPAGVTVAGLSAGGTHSLILAGGKVYVAGSDRYGQLGQGAVNGASKTSFTPVAIPSSTPVAVAAGGNHSLIVTASGKVFACGDNTYGQLAQPTLPASLGTLVEVVFPGLSTKIVSVVAGADHNLAVDEGGGVWVWGRNNYGQLGKGTRTVADRTPSKLNLGKINSVDVVAKSVAAGFSHSLILTTDGKVFGFGRNNSGQTGQSATSSVVLVPTLISGLNGIRSIAAGTDSSFAIAESGQLYSWGYNSYGELLLGYASPTVYVPTQSPVCRNVFNVSGGGYSSLAWGVQGLVFGGRNDVGQAGNGPDPDQVVGDYYYGTGNLALANLTMDLAGTTETLYDQIFVGSGAVTLNGILNLMFVGTYTGPVYGSTQTFDLIWAKNGIVFGTGYQLAFNQAGYLVESAVADKIVEGVSGKVLQATVRAVVTAADLAKAVNLARPSLDGVESVSYSRAASGTGISTLSVSSGVEMIYSYERPTGGVSSGAQYFFDGITYRVEQVSSLTGAWGDASVSGTTVTPLGNGYERATLRISASGSAGFLRLTSETPQATGIGAGVGNATSN